MFHDLFASEASAMHIVISLGVAALCGGIIGFERELRDRPAGLRTNMMVALAAAMFTLLTHELAVEAGREAGDHLKIDTLRIIEAVIAGVAFLGAGAIFRSGGHVGGLTTGASLWMSGALGVASGAGFLKLALFGVAFAVVILIVIGRFEVHVLNSKQGPETPPPAGAGS